MKLNTENFADYLKKFDRFTTMSIVSLLLVPFVLDLFFSLQPPWPKHSTYITAFLELSVIFLAFYSPIKNTKLLFKRQKMSFFLILFFFILYFLLHSWFVVETPLTGEHVVTGFVCTTNAKIIAAQLSEKCPFLTETLLMTTQYETEIVWTSWSVRTMEFVIFIAWTSFFIVSTYLFGISVAFLSRQESIARNEHDRLP